MPAAGQALRFNPAAIRNFVFFAAVIAMNYTLSRPSPVDYLFVTALGLSVFVNQSIRSTFLIMTGLLLAWTVSFHLASLPYSYDPVVREEAFKKTFVVALAVIAGYVSMSWRERQYLRFFKVYVTSCLIAASIGIYGFIFKVELLLWDGRAKAFIDDPNMYGSFLIPGALFCLHLIHYRQGRKLFFVPAFAVICLGVLLSLSRAANVALLVVLGGYVIFMNRDNVARLMAYLAAIVLSAALIFSTAALVVPRFSDKFLERATIATQSDTGAGGRYARYIRSIPMILDNPAGLGIEQQEKVFLEPIHNIFLSSFLNYGWLGGFAWLVLFMLSLALGIRNFLLTGNPIAVLLVFAYLGPVLCALLHEGEHWRHLWLLLGTLWGFDARKFRAGAMLPRAAAAGRRAALAAPPRS